MSWIDTTLFVVIGLSMLLGFYRGLVREVLALLVWGLGIWLAVHYSAAMAGYFAAHVESNSIRLLISFVSILVSVLFVGAILIHLIVSLIRLAPFSFIDRFLGLGFGVVRGALLSASMVFVAGLTNLPQKEVWHASVVVPHLQWVADYAQEHLPKQVSELLEKSYT